MARKLSRRHLLTAQVEALRKQDALRPFGTVDLKMAMSLIHYCTLNSVAAEDLYWAMIEGLWLWKPEAEGYRVAVQAKLREVAEAGVDADHARDVQVYNRCPECKRDDYFTYPSGQQECRCGEIWRPVSLRMQRDRAERERQYQRA